MLKLVALVCICTTIPAAFAASVTYPGLGTFNSADFFDSIARPYTYLFLPASPQAIGPTFSLYTPANRDTEDKLEYNSTESINSSHFDGSLPTKIFVHGYMDSVAKGNWMRELKDRYLDWEDTNVILVDWSRGNRPPYGQATVNARVIGAMIGVEIQALNRVKGAPLESFHILGHSLGAHVSAYAGKFLKGALGRITGLDAAGPYFAGTKPEARLWCTDAQFVDGIHTDAAAGGYGMYETYADVDFYPNGGSNQPGCAQEQANPSQFPDPVRTALVCNHARAVDFYIDSVNRSISLPKAYQCDSFQSYENGKCIDCGAGEEKCALLGPRAVEYKKFATKSQTTNGKRQFLVTDLHRPTLTKYQYDIAFNSSSGTQIAVATVGPKLVTGFSTNGNSENLYIDNKALAGTGIAGVLSIDPIDLNRITIAGTSTALVNAVQVIGFTASSSTPESPAIVMNFCKTATSGSFEKC